MAKIYRLDGSTVQAGDEGVTRVDEAVRVFAEIVREVGKKAHTEEERDYLRASVFYATGFFVGLDPAHLIALREVGRVMLGEESDLDVAVTLTAGQMLANQYASAMYNAIMANSLKEPTDETRAAVEGGTQSGDGAQSVDKAS